MIALGDIWSDINSDPRVINVRFNRRYLRMIGNLVERRGFHETKLYLWDNLNRSDLEYQSSALLSILSRLEREEEIRGDNTTAGYILKELSVLKSLK